MEKIGQDQIRVLAEKVCLMLNNLQHITCNYNNDQPHYQTAKYGDVEFYIRFDEYKQRIFVGATKLKSQRDDWYWSFNITTIGMSLRKGVTAIVRDIETRFLPDFLKASEAILQHRADHYKYLDNKASVKSQVEKAFQFEGTKANDDIYSSVKNEETGLSLDLVISIRPDKFDLKISGLPPEKAQAIADVLRA